MKKIVITIEITDEEYLEACEGIHEDLILSDIVDSIQKLFPLNTYYSIKIRK